MSIRVKMVLVFSVMSVLILLASSITGYIFTENHFADNIESQMHATIHGQVNKFDGWLTAKQKMVELTAGTVQAVIGKGQVPASLLSGYKNWDKELEDIYFGSSEGKIVTGKGWVPPSGFDPRTRVWYKEALHQNKTIFTDPYVDADTKEMMVSVALPYLSLDGQVRGVISGDITLRTLVENVKGINFDGKGYAFLIDKKGNILAHPDTEVVAKNLFEMDKLKDVSRVVKGILGSDQGYLYYQENGKDMIMVYEQIPSTQWTLCLNVEKNVAFQSLSYLKWLFIVTTMISILLVIAVTFTVAKRITKPIEKLSQQVELLANGDLTVKAEIEGHDEIAKLAAGFNKMVGDLRGMIHDIYESTIELQGSSNKLIDISSNVAANSEEMSATVGMVSAAVQQISAGSEENASSTEQVSSNVGQVAKKSNEMSAAAKEAVRASESVAKEVKEVSNVIEEVSQSIQQVSVFAQEVAASCKRSIAITAEAKIRSRETNEIIHQLNVSSKQINKIVDIIRNIAEQTNMLALNATIEAASAGEAGRGFAVVAGEVKELSKRTAEEAGRIALQIEEMQTNMTEAVQVVGKISDVIAETMDITETIASAVSEQSFQSDSCEDKANGVNRVTTINKEVAAIASKAEHVSRNALEAAKGVESMVCTSAQISQKAEEVARNTDEMETMMTNIAQATQEIARGTQDISLNIHEADKAIVDTATKATKVSECAYDVGEMANRMKELVGKFKV